MTAADKKLAEDMAEFNDNLQQLIATTVENEATEREMAIAYATGMITGNLGGYVILHSSTNADYPDEILIMDTMNVETAKKIWRWNKSGLGYSNTGYEGPYTLAMTQEGVFVADFIQSGSINASLITTGFMSASIIKGGTLILGGADNGNGTFLLRDNSNNSIAYMSNAGLSLYKGTISGPSITIGGANNQNGSITVLNSNGAVSGTWNNNSLTVNQNGQLRITATAKNLSGADVERITTFNNGIRMTYGGTQMFSLAPVNMDGKLIGHAISETGDIFGIGIYNTSTGVTDMAYVCNCVSFDNSRYFKAYQKNLFLKDTLFCEDVYYDTTARMRGQGSSLRNTPFIRGWAYSTKPHGQFEFFCSDAFFDTGDENAYANLHAASYNYMSSRRFKKNIQKMEEEEAFKILDIESVSFDYINGKTGNYGVIAEDVYEKIPYAVTLDNEDNPFAVDYTRFVPYLIKMVQMQQKQINELIETLKKKGVL